MSENIQVTSTVSPVILFLLLFVALKLTGYIAWSWLWVLSPLWIPFAVVLFVAALYFVAAGILFVTAFVSKK